METVKGRVGVIIPVYNTGSYLYKCVDSILNQSYGNMEIIIVDDGSNEETASICDEVATWDCRIRLVHKKNEGVSIARNTGIVLATGEYVGFVDSDDWIEQDMFSTLIYEIESSKVDVVMCDATTVWDNGKTELDTFVCLPKSCILYKSDITPIRQLELAGSSCRVLYRTRQLREYGILFPAGLKFSEDRIFNMIVLGRSSRVRYIKKSFYNRYVREGSCVNTFFKDFVDVTLRVNEVMKNVLLTYWDSSYVEAFERRNLRSIANHIIQTFQVEDMSLSMKWREVKKDCKNKRLQQLLQEQPRLDFTMRQIQKDRTYLLFLCALKERAKTMVRNILRRWNLH